VRRIPDPINPLPHDGQVLLCIFSNLGSRPSPFAVQAADFLQLSMQELDGFALSYPFGEVGVINTGRRLNALLCLSFRIRLALTRSYEFAYIASDLYS
jgi:hypothetical protein